MRLALGIAAAGLHDRARAEKMLNDAIRLDPSAQPPKIALARVLAATDPAEANKLLDQVLAADPRSVEGLLIKGELERIQGHPKAALSRFDAALAIDPKNVAVRSEPRQPQCCRSQLSGRRRRSRPDPQSSAQ